MQLCLTKKCCYSNGGNLTVQHSCKYCFCFSIWEKKTGIEKKKKTINMLKNFKYSIFVDIRTLLWQIHFYGYIWQSDFKEHRNEKYCEIGPTWTGAPQNTNNYYKTAQSGMPRDFWRVLDTSLYVCVRGQRPWPLGWCNFAVKLIVNLHSRST